MRKKRTTKLPDDVAKSTPGAEQVADRIFKSPRDPRMAFFGDDPDEPNDDDELPFKSPVPPLSQGPSKDVLPFGQTAEEITAKNDPVRVNFPRDEKMASPVFVDPTPRKPLAKAEVSQPVPKGKRYLVKRTQPISYGGYRTLLRKGSIVEELHYDMEHLFRQNVELEEIE